MKILKNIQIYLNSKSFWITCILIFLISIGCNQKEQIPETRKLSPFERAIMGGEITPLANGDAYLLGFREIFYINGHSATRVTGIENGMIVGGEIIALSDGSAIFQGTSVKNKGLYRLNRNIAALIVEDGLKFSSHNINNNNFLFVQNQKLRHENKNRKQILNEINED